MTTRVHQCSLCGCLYQHIDQEYCNYRYYDGKCDTCSLLMRVNDYYP
jgi:hypothetical protein